MVTGATQRRHPYEVLPHPTAVEGERLSGEVRALRVALRVALRGSTRAEQSGPADTVAPLPPWFVASAQRVTPALGTDRTGARPGRASRAPPPVVGTRPALLPPQRPRPLPL